MFLAQEKAKYLCVWGGAGGGVCFCVSTRHSSLFCAHAADKLLNSDVHVFERQLFASGQKHMDTSAVLSVEDSKRKLF